MIENSENNKVIREHLALFFNAELNDFCTSFTSLLGLPQMSFDFENETEWGEVDQYGINYNISRPYEIGTLHEWDSSVPKQCNFGISLTFKNNHVDEKTRSEVVKLIGSKLSKEFNTTVFHHRTWFGPGKNVTRNLIFKPA